MPTPKPRPATETKQTTSQRSVSGVFRRAFGSEEDALRLLRDLEQDSLFRTLLSEGVVRRFHLRGVIPYNEYADYMIERAVAFVRKHSLDSRPEWRNALLSRNSDPVALSRWAAAWRVPEGELRRVLGFLRSQAAPRREPTISDPSLYGSGSAPSDAEELSNVIEIAAAFVRRHGLSQQEFVDCVLSGNAPSAEIASRFACSVDEAVELCAAVSRFHILEAFDQAPTSRQGATGGTPQVSKLVVAHAEVHRTTGLRLQILDERLTARYSINRDALRAWGATESNDQLRDIVDRISAINERCGAMHVLLHTTCSLQRDFIASGDLIDMRPLFQAEVARRIQYHRSVVSRLVREKLIETPHGRYELAELMPGPGEVIARTACAHPDWTDARIAQHLFDRFAVRLSRRVVNYHRRVRLATEPPITAKPTGGRRADAAYRR